MIKPTLAICKISANILDLFSLTSNAKRNPCVNLKNCPDGSFCRKNKHCLSGNCLDKVCVSVNPEQPVVTPDPWVRTWAITENITSIQDFGLIEKDAYGSDNRQYVLDPAEGSNTVMRVEYPEGSYVPSKNPVGGTGFYAQPIDIKNASFVSLSYKVFFPVDFDFVKGGKLPGIYGGHATCSGGNAALDCFSTRYMFRTDGLGELYAYVEKSKQATSFCQVPPFSLCNSLYGASIGRGSFTFVRGEWTHLVQNITLNSPGKTDGKVLIVANGKLAINHDQVQWRNDESVRFVGIDFATFFGGSTSSWATPKTQHAYFKDFSITAF